MLLNEIINEVGMTKRAVKYYEEKGLLSVDKGFNDLQTTHPKIASEWLEKNLPLKPDEVNAKSTAFLSMWNLSRRL